MIDQYGKTLLTYNAAGQPVTIEDPLGNTTTFTYDLSDLVQVTDPLGRASKRYEYDVIDRVTRMTDALGQLTQYSFDANSNLSKDIQLRCQAVTVPITEAISNEYY